MTKTIYVGNLSWETTEQDLNEVFAQYGKVESSRIVTERDTGRSRGFGFVEMSDDDADRAIAALNGTELGGRTLTVNVAQDRPTAGGS